MLWIVLQSEIEKLSVAASVAQPMSVALKSPVTIISVPSGFELIKSSKCDRSISVQCGEI